MESQSVSTGVGSCPGLSNQCTFGLINQKDGRYPPFTDRLSIIFLWEGFSQRAPIPIVNPLLKTVCIFGGIWGAHYYSASPKNNNKTDNFRNRPPILVLNC